MSMPMKQPFPCPHCGKAEPFTIWNSINITLNPEMKPKILDQSAFTFHCPHCGKDSQVGYDMLYHDMDQHLMLYLAMSDHSEDMFYKMLTYGFPDVDMNLLQDKQYQLRIVRSHNVLNEKILLFDAGRDDRIIEICKALLSANLAQKQEELDKLQLLYEPKQKDRPEGFDVFKDKKPVGFLDMPAGFYDLTAAQYGKDLGAMDEQDFLVDRHWALEKLSHDPVM